MAQEIYFSKSQLTKKMALCFFAALTTCFWVSFVGYPLWWSLIVFVTCIGLCSYAIYLQSVTPVLQLKNGNIIINDYFAGKVNIEINSNELNKIHIEKKMLLIVVGKEKYKINVNFVDSTKINQFIENTKTSTKGSF